MDQSNPSLGHQHYDAYSVRSPSLASPRIHPTSPGQYMVSGGGRSTPNFRKMALTQQHHPIVADSSSNRTQHVYMANPAIHDNVPPMPSMHPIYMSPSSTTHRQHQHPAMAASSPAMTATPPPPAAHRHHHHHHHHHHATSYHRHQQSYSMPSSRRNDPTKRTKRVPLYKGNLVIECPVPSRLMHANPRKDTEFSHMRYSAVTCDPDDFARSRYTLRPRLMNRQTELFIVMTMYNVCILRIYIAERNKDDTIIGRSRVVLSDHAWCHEKYSTFMLKNTFANVGHRRMEKGGCMYCCRWPKQVRSRCLECACSYGCLPTRCCQKYGE